MIVEKGRDCGCDDGAMLHRVGWIDIFWLRVDGGVMAELLDG